MKKVKLLILGILSVIGLSSITFGYTSNGITYQNGIYRNESKGLLTYIYNDTAFSIADKFIGQTDYQLAGEVPLGSASLFVQGNNFAFRFLETYPLGLSISDGSIYGPGNYLNTGVLPTSNNWVSSNYSNMWGAVDGTFEAMRGPCPLGFHVMSSGEFLNFYNVVSSLGCFEQFSTYSQGVYIVNGNYYATNSYYYSLSSLFDKGYIRGAFCQGGSISSNLGHTHLYPVRCIPNSLKLPTSNNRTLEYQGSLENLPEESEPEEPEPGEDLNGTIDGSVFDYQTYLIEQAILCYMSSGFVGNCENINYVGFVDQYQHQNPWWSLDNQHGSLTFTNAQDILTQYCINSSLIEYPFCSQLDLYNGAYLTYFYDTGNLEYYILGSGFAVDLGNSGSGQQLSGLTCFGLWCDNVSQGLPEYHIPLGSSGAGSINYGYSGTYLSYSYFIDFFRENLFFSCPFSYSGSYFTIGKKLIDLLGGRDILKPINCMFAGFSAGNSTSFFGDPKYGTYFTGTLVNGDSPGYFRLFTFFDILLGLGYILFYSYIFKFLKHR